MVGELVERLVMKMENIRICAGGMKWKHCKNNEQKVISGRKNENKFHKAQNKNW